ncbi:hypothetical protein D3C85_1775320 [compost metagenome]
MIGKTGPSIIYKVPVVTIVSPQAVMVVAVIITVSGDSTIPSPTGFKVTTIVSSPGKNVIGFGKLL